MKFSAKHASLATGFKDNNSVKKKKNVEKAAAVSEEKKQENTANPPPPPPPNLNVKPPPPLVNLLGNTNLNSQPQTQTNKEEEKPSFDPARFENARNELKRRMEEKKAEEKFEDCIKIREKIKVFIVFLIKI